MAVLRKVATAALDASTRDVAALDLDGLAALRAALAADPAFVGEFWRRIARLSPDQADAVLRQALAGSQSAAAHLKTAREVLAGNPPEFLVDGTVGRGEVATLVGPANSGKTFITLSLAVAASLGRPWLGRATMQVPVVYVAAEGASSVQPRLRALMDDIGLADLPSLFVWDNPVLLSRSSAVFAFAERIAPVAPGLIVFDTLAMCLLGADENSAKDMGMACDAMRNLARRFGSTVLAVHHTGKDGRAERGSGALRGAVDTQIDLRVNGSNLRLDCVKQRNFERFEPLPVVLRAVTGSLVADLGDAVMVRGSRLDERTVIEDAVRVHYAVAGTDRLTKSALINKVGGNRSDRMHLIDDLATDPTSPLTLTKQGRSHIIEWRPIDTAETSLAGTDPPVPFSL